MRLRGEDRSGTEAVHYESRREMHLACLVSGSIGLLLLTAGCAHSPARSHYSGPVIDVHLHLDPEHEIVPNRVADAPTLLRELQRLDKAWGGLITIAPKGNIEATRAQNDRVLAMAREHPKQLFAFISVHPDDGQLALDEVDRGAAAGARGLKLHPNTQRFDVSSPAVAAVVERAALRGLPILFDGFSPFDANQTGKFLMLALTQPKAKIVLAHMGGTRFSDMMLFAIARQFSWYPRNVWLELSAVAHVYARSPYADQLVFVCRSVGLDRVLFGSDFPVVTPHEAVEDIRALGFTAEEEKQVLYQTAAELFGLQT
jgi:predicted TIM-barrel fold metal-dependent hydrolase